MATSPSKEVKAPQHLKTRRSRLLVEVGYDHRNFRLALIVVVGEALPPPRFAITVVVSPRRSGRGGGPPGVLGLLRAARALIFTFGGLVARSPRAPSGFVLGAGLRVALVVGPAHGWSCPAARASAPRAQSLSWQQNQGGAAASPIKASAEGCVGARDCRRVRWAAGGARRSSRRAPAGGRRFGCCPICFLATGARARSSFRSSLLMLGTAQYDSEGL